MKQITKKKAAEKNGRKQKKLSGGDIWKLSGTETAGCILTGAAAGVFAVWLCYHSVKAMPAAIVVTVLYYFFRKKELQRNHRQQMRNHFRDYITSVHVAMRSGYSLENAVRCGRNDVEALYGEKDMLVQELDVLIRQMEYRIPVEQLFRELGSISQIEEISFFGEMLMIAKRTGGNLGKVLSDTWRTLTRRIDTEQEIASLIEAKRYEQSIMSLMPAGIILYLRFSFQGFIEKLYGNPMGVLVMTAALGLYLTAFWLGRRFVRIEV